MKRNQFTRASKVKGRDERLEARKKAHEASAKKLRNAGGYNFPQPPAGKGPGRRNRFKDMSEAKEALARSNGGLRTFAAQDYIDRFSGKGSKPSA